MIGVIMVMRSLGSGGGGEGGRECEGLVLLFSYNTIRMRTFAEVFLKIRGRIYNIVNNLTQRYSSVLV